MFTFLLVLQALIAAMLVGVILVQQSKAADSAWAGVLRPDVGTRCGKFPDPCDNGPGERVRIAVDCAGGRSDAADDDGRDRYVAGASTAGSGDTGSGRAAVRCAKRCDAASVDADPDGPGTGGEACAGRAAGGRYTAEPPARSRSRSRRERRRARRQHRRLSCPLRVRRRTRTKYAGSIRRLA